ncbi:MAG: hypothetical protein A3A51_03875 [Candidatus Levybacteria bacterium RIFCSPLOWO2_01_FULL_39_10]|nr:MAG: hypothetical protein A3A51_03875 [Candidatus Levybacteria bacterium RIFCSPLOWO2_01_FULL_39_10]
MTYEELLKQQEELQYEGQEVLGELKINEQFSKLGKIVIGGSLISGLMTWRDIDIGVEVENMPSKNDLSNLFTSLLSNSKILQLNYSDNTELINLHHPKGIYFGIKYQKEKEKIWKIDLWFISPEDNQQSIEDLKWLQQKITQETKMIILSIKNEIDTDPRYKKSIFSIDIYKAVIENGVKDLEAFKKYLKGTGRSIN